MPTLPSADVNRLRRSSLTDDTSTLNCSANSTATDSASSVGPSTSTSVGSGGSDSVFAQVWRTSALIRAVLGRRKGDQSFQLAVQRIVHRRIIAPG